MSEVEGALEALCDGARSYAFRALESLLLKPPVAMLYSFMESMMQSDKLSGFVLVHASHRTTSPTAGASSSDSSGSLAHSCRR